MKKGNRTKILKLLGVLLADYKQTATNVITETPQKDEKAALKSLDEEVLKYNKDFKDLLKTEKKNMFFLFMSHKSGDHGLTAHTSLKSLKEELQSVVDLINEDATEEQQKENNKAVEEATGDGSYAELSDSTWFDVFEIKI